MARKQRRSIATKTHDEIFGEMVEGLTHAIDIARGEADPSSYRVHVPKDMDVKSIRQKTGLSQKAFAGAFGFSAGSVRDWEQRRVMPDQAARAYLYVIGQKPDMVRETLAPIADTATALARKVTHGAAMKGRRSAAKPKRAVSHLLGQQGIRRPGDDR